MLFATGCDAVNVYRTFVRTCNWVRVVFGVDNYRFNICELNELTQFCMSFLHVSLMSIVPYHTRLISSVSYLHLICFYVFRFWTVRCTVWTCSCYRAPCAKPVIPQDWALLYQYEWSVLLEDIFCASPFETQQARCWNSFNTTSILPLLCSVFSFYLYFFYHVVSCCSCGLQLSKQKHLLIGLIWKTTYIDLVRNKIICLCVMNCGLFECEICYLETIFLPPVSRHFV